MLSGSCQADPVTVACEQYCADLVFQLLDSPCNAVAGHAQPASRRSKAAGARHFKENPDALPIRNSAVALTSRVLNFVSTDSRI